MDDHKCVTQGVDNVQGSCKDSKFKGMDDI